MDFIPIYCINLPHSKERKARMEHRFKYYKLEKYVRYVEGILWDAPIIKYYHQGIEQPKMDIKHWNSEMACFASHLKALKTFIAEGHPEALICEDDILLRNDFPNEYQKVRQNFPEDAPLVSLSYMIEKWEGYVWSGLHPEKHNLAKLSQKYTWVVSYIGSPENMHYKQLNDMINPLDMF